MTSGYQEVLIYDTPIPNALNGEGNLIRETLSDKMVPRNKEKKTHEDNIHYQGDAFWVILMPAEEDELAGNEVTTLGKPTPVDWSNPIRRVRYKKTHQDILCYQRNMFRAVLMPDG